MKLRSKQLKEITVSQRIMVIRIRAFGLLHLSILTGYTMMHNKEKNKPDIFSCWTTKYL